MTTGNLPAYPIEAEKTYYLGLTKRELFAAMAMQGLLSDMEFIKKNSTGLTAVELAVCTADALIAELNKEVQS